MNSPLLFTVALLLATGPAMAGLATDRQRIATAAALLAHLDLALATAQETTAREIGNDPRGACRFSWLAAELAAEAAVTWPSELTVSRSGAAAAALATNCR